LFELVGIKMYMSGLQYTLESIFLFRRWYKIPVFLVLSLPLLGKWSPMTSYNLNRRKRPEEWHFKHRCYVSFLMLIYSISILSCLFCDNLHRWHGTKSFGHLRRFTTQEATQNRYNNISSIIPQEGFENSESLRIKKENY